MPNDLVRIKDWVNANGDAAANTLTAALALSKNLSTNHDRPRQILTGIPDADRAVAEAAGVAEIAGEYGVDPGEVIKVAGMLLSLGLTFI